MHSEDVLQSNDDICRRRPVWLELEAALLALLVGAAFFTRLDELPIRGDESNWAVVADEMRASGDWIVPRRQGVPFPDRPPLNSWCIALSTVVFGHWRPIAVRFPSVLAVLATTLGLYCYARNYLSRVGALASAAAFATTIHELISGRLAESDNMLTCFLAGSLFVWSAGYLRGWSPTRTWIIGYSLAALAALAKGPQGPIYFVASTCSFLAWRRDWRYLLSRSHVAGLVSFVAILGIWQVLFFWRTDWQSVLAIWSEEGHLDKRFDYTDWRQALQHLALFPFGVFAAMLPWSFMLIAFASRWLRQSLGEAKPYAQFLGVSCLVTVPTVWLATNAGPRYIMSMYPVAAALVGIAVERCWQSAGASFWQRSWSRFLISGAGLTVVAGIVALCCGGVMWGPPLSSLQQPPWFAVVCSLACFLCAGLMFWAQSGAQPVRAQVGILAVASILSLAMAGVVLNMKINVSLNPAINVAELRTQLPRDVSLVSLGPIHHRFAYYYGAPVKLLDWSARDINLPSSVEYFCITQYEDRPIELPFAWEPIGVVPCDRAPRDAPNRVVVGRRVGSSPDSAKAPAPPVVIAAPKPSTTAR